jgi:hypothetical protein
VLAFSFLCIDPDSRFAFSLLSGFNGTLTRASLRDLSQKKLAGRQQ